MKSVQDAAASSDDARYSYERTLGQGGAGEVFLVRDRETGEHLALKKLLRMDSKSVLRLKREFRSLADMHHPNLVKLYDLGHASDAWFLTMEYVPGRDLLAYVDREPPAGVDATARLSATFRQLALGVRALHQAGMLHRDLKPSNVLVSDQGRVVVLDFGLVRELANSDSKVTEEGSIAGTPAYMAPEQAMDKQLTEACDWYAFGVMLFEALAGELPFDGGAMQVLRMKLAMDPTPLEEAQGSPFLAFQLAALAEAKLARGDDLESLSLDELVEQTGALLPVEAKHMLATLAVAGRPMLPKLALRAAGVKHDGRSHLHALRGLNLVRTRDAAGERLVEVYHDRVRERVQSSLTTAQRANVHESLLRAVEFSGQADSEWLHTLALGANQRAQALHYGLLAAERATATLAFERAAELYQQCLELSDEPAADGAQIWRRLAQALACCGRGARAATAYLEAAKHSAGEDALALTRFAASHLLRSDEYCAEAWPLYLRSLGRRTAISTLTMRPLHIQLQLNRHVALGSAGDPDALVREDLRALAKLPFPAAQAMATTTHARLALLRGERPRASALLAQSADAYDACDRPDDATRGRYALGIVVGGSEGETLRAQAERTLLDKGYPDPARDLRTYYPELVGGGPR